MKKKILSKCAVNFPRQHLYWLPIWQLKNKEALCKSLKGDVAAHNVNRTCMLLNVAAHNVSIRNVKV